MSEAGQLSWFSWQPEKGLRLLCACVASLGNISFYVFLSVITQYKILLWLWWLLGPDSISVVLANFHDLSTPIVTFYSTVYKKRVIGIYSGWHSYWTLIICQTLWFRKRIPFSQSIYLHAVEGHGFCKLW